MTPPFPSCAPDPAAGGHEGMRGASPRPLMGRSWLRQLYFLFSRKVFPLGPPPSALPPPEYSAQTRFLFTLPPGIHFGRWGALLTPIASLGELRLPPARGAV